MSTKTPLIDLNCDRVIFTPGHGVAAPVSGYAPISIEVMQEWIARAQRQQAEIDRAIANMRDLIREAEGGAP